jgi:hypothetical protein
MLRPHSYQPPENGLPPQEVRILSLRAEPWPENARRVRIHLELTPFKERPDIEVSITDAGAHEVASINIVESIEGRMTFTMHLRGETMQGPYTLSASVLYPEIGSVDQKNVPFETSEETQS